MQWSDLVLVAHGRHGVDVELEVWVRGGETVVYELGLDESERGAARADLDGLLGVRDGGWGGGLGGHVCGICGKDFGVRRGLYGLG